MFPFLFRKEVKDHFAQTNFTRLSDYFRDSPIERYGFKFFEWEVPGAGTFDFPHRLGIVPKDIVITYNSANGPIFWNYADFDTTNVNYTAGGATTIRALIGRYG